MQESVRERERAVALDLLNGRIAGGRVRSLPVGNLERQRQGPSCGVGLSQWLAGNQKLRAGVWSQSQARPKAPNSNRRGS